MPDDFANSTAEREARYRVLRVNSSRFVDGPARPELETVASSPAEPSTIGGFEDVSVMTRAQLSEDFYRLWHSPTVRFYLQILTASK